MKKLLIFGFMIVMMFSFVPVTQAQTRTSSLGLEDRKILILQLTLKVQELVKELNVLLERQDTLIQREVSMSRVNAEIYFTMSPEVGFLGVCSDVVNRLTSSTLLKQEKINVSAENITCYDSKEKYVLSVKTSKGYSCADSTGVMKTTSGPAILLGCLVK